MSEHGLNRPLLGSEETTVTVPDDSSDESKSGKHHVQDFEQEYNAKRDPDAFLKQIYEYHQQGGYWNSIFRSLFDLIGVLFIFFLLVFVFCVIDYHALARMLDMAQQDCPGTRQPATPHLLRRDCHGNQPVNWDAIKNNVGLYFGFALFTFVWLFLFVQFLLRLPALGRTKRFYQQLQIMIAGKRVPLTDRRLQHLPWSSVVTAILDFQKQTGVISTKRKLSPWELMCIMLRHDNFMLSLYEKGLIQTDLTCPCLCFSLSMRFFPHSLKMIIDYVIKAAVFDSSTSNIRSKVKANNQEHHAIVAASIKIAFRMIGFAYIFLFPGIFLYQLATFLFTHSDILKESPTLLATRHWTPFAKTRLRRYNEAPHYLKRRLGRAYQPTIGYINAFQSRWLSNMAEFLIMLLGGLVLVLYLMFLVWDDEFAFADLAGDRSAGWWLAVLVAAVQICRGLMPAEHVVMEPRERFAEMNKHITFGRNLSEFQADSVLDHVEEDPSWDEAQAAVAALLQPKLRIVFEEVFGILIVPYMLIFRLPHAADDIVNHFHASHHYVDGLGDQLKSMKASDPQNAAQLSSLSMGASATEPQQAASDAFAGSRRRMNESMTAFTANYPSELLEAMGSSLHGPDQF